MVLHHWTRWPPCPYMVKTLIKWFLFTVNEKVSTMFGHHYHLSGIKSIPVNSEQFMKLEETKIPVDDRFFHR